MLLVDDAVSSGTALEAFADELQNEGANLIGAFTLVDMRDVATSVALIATTLPIESIATYLDIRAAATDHGVLDPATHQLAVDALINHWPNEDPRWTLLNHAA